MTSLKVKRAISKPACPPSTSSYDLSRRYTRTFRCRLSAGKLFQFVPVSLISRREFVRLLILFLFMRTFPLPSLSFFFLSFFSTPFFFSSFLFLSFFLSSFFYFILTITKHQRQHQHHHQHLSTFFSLFFFFPFFPFLRSSIKTRKIDTKSWRLACALRKIVTHK